MLSNDRLGSADAYPGVPGERANADADWAGAMPVFGAGCETAAGERRARAGRGGSGRARQIHKSAGQKRGGAFHRGLYEQRGDAPPFLPRHGRYSAIMAWER